MLQDRSAVFNNAGVLILNKKLTRRDDDGVVGYVYLVIALELFRGALESKLTYERQTLTLRGSQPEMPSSWESFMTAHAAQCIHQAETHMHRLPTYLSSSDVAMPTGSPTPEEYNIGSTSSLSGPPNPSTAVEMLYSTAAGLSSVEPIVVPADCRGYNPFLYAVPFQIPDELLSSQLESCCILYNLALTHQIIHPTADQARQLYSIAAALVMMHLYAIHEDDIVCVTIMGHLRVAILNNLAVWCYENGYTELLSECLEHLPLLLQDTMDMNADVMDAKDIAGIRTNVRHFLVPPNGNSPAA